MNTINEEQSELCAFLALPAETVSLRKKLKDHFAAHLNSIAWRILEPTKDSKGKIARMSFTHVGPELHS